MSLTSNKKTRPRKAGVLRLQLWEERSAASEFGVGFHAQFGHVETVDLCLFVDPQADSGLEHGKDNQRGHEARNAMISKAITEGKPAGRKVVNPHPDKLRAWKGERGRLANTEINSYYKQYLVNSYLKNLKAIY